MNRSIDGARAKDFCFQEWVSMFLYGYLSYAWPRLWEWGWDI